MKNKFYRNIVLGCVLSLAGGAGSALAQGMYTSKPSTQTQTTTSTSNQADDSQDSPLSRQARAASTASPAGKGALSADDQSFILDAAKGGMMEVEMGRMAESNATSAEVKKFGARMVADHGKANSELTSIARSKGVHLPAGKSAGKWKGDKTYVDMMVKDHEKDLADFRKEAQNGSDPELRRFAEKTSSVVEKHLGMAKDLQAKAK